MDHAENSATDGCWRNTCTLFDCTVWKPQLILKCKYMYDVFTSLRSTLSKTAIVLKKDIMSDWLGAHWICSHKGFDVEKKEKLASIHIFPLVCPSWTRKHTEVVIMINQLACFLILDGPQRVGHNSSHVTGKQVCSLEIQIMLGMSCCCNKYIPIHNRWLQIIK